MIAFCLFPPVPYADQHPSPRGNEEMTPLGVRALSRPGGDRAKPFVSPDPDPDKRRRTFRTTCAGSTTYSLTPFRRPHWAKTVRLRLTLHAPHAARIRLGLVKQPETPERTEFPSGSNPVGAPL